MFKVYKPKGDHVRAVQVTMNTQDDIADLFMGRVTTEDTDSSGQITNTGVDIPTLDGIQHVPMMGWLVRGAQGRLKILTDQEFNETYEPAYNTATRTT